MKYFRFIPVVVLSICTTFLTHSAFSQTSPETSAPAPEGRNASDVISMYSDQYQQTTVDTYLTSWSVLDSQEEVAIESNQTLVYRDLDYAGISTEAEPINASNMEMVHFDVWTSDVNSFRIKFVDFNGTGYNDGLDNIEFEISNTIGQQGQWVSFDIPLTEFTGVPFLDINQIVIGADPVGTIFLDNLYFWKESTTPNQAPVTTDDTLTVAEDSNLKRKDVVENDTDADNDPLILTGFSYDGDGAVGINTDNVSLNYTPLADFNGTETITYTVSDGTDTATGTLTVTVTAVDDAPVAVEDELTVIEDANLTSKNVIENDTDVDQDTLTLTEVSYTGDGIVAVNTDGVSVDYTPAAEFNGAETITYTVSDGTLSATGTLTVTVTAINDNIPVAVDDTLTVDEDSDVTSKNVVENDTDADNDPLTLTEFSYDGDGAVAINTDNVSIDYTPVADFNGTETITYTISDGTDTATGTLTVEVTAVNDAPVAVEDELTVIEDADLTSKNVIENDTDVDQDTLTLTAVSYTGDGIVAVNSDNVSIDYTPAADYDGTETITYTVSDGTLSTTGILTVTVTAVNDNVPVTEDDTLTVDEDSDLTSKNVVENDTDADNDPLILTEFSYVGDGIVAINTDNVSIDYTPVADFNGPETITYTISDGTDTATGTLTVEVTAINDAPVAVEDELTVIEDADLTSKNVIENDTDVDQDTLTLTEVSYTEGGIAAINSDGVSVDYTPAADFNGTETITYTVSDGTTSTTGTLSVTVTSVNDAPIAVNDLLTVDEDSDVTSKNVVENDTDLEEDTLFLTEVTTDRDGTVVANSDTVSVDYTPAADFNGTETITYTISDGTDTTTGTLTVTVNSIKDAPVAVADTFSVDEDAALTSIDVVGNDIDVDGDTLILASVTSAGSGTVSVNADGVSVDYTPAANFNGTEIINYVVSDRSFTATGTLTITVNALDDTAIAVADNLTVLEDAVLTSKNVIENDLHGDDITLTLTGVSYTGDGIAAVNSDNASVDYTPAENYNGIETITYTVSDGTNSATGTLTVTVTSVNDLPVVLPDTLEVAEDATKTSKDVIANDTDPVELDTLTLTAVTTDENGTVAINTDNVSIDYTPAADFNGTETITYTVSDGTDTATGTLTVTVTAVDDAPVAVDDVLTVIEDADLTSKNVIENDTDVDLDTLTLTEVSYTGDGIVAVNSDNASIDYTPAADYDGTETITYTVSDGTLSTTGTLTVTVSPLNDNVPVAVSDTETVLEDAATTSINVVGNDTDADEDSLVLASVTTAGSGIVSVNSNGVSVDYTPALNFNGSEIITYTVSDGTDTATGTLTVDVTAVNDAPVAIDDREIISENSSLRRLDVILNDTDVEGDALSLIAVTTAGSGTVDINADQESVDYTPAQGFKGTEIITYTVSDGSDSDSTGTLTILVSDDAREVITLASNSLSQDESGSFEITATINSVSTEDVFIPFVLSGGAILGEDYTVSFDSEGEETQILDLQNQYYGTMRSFPDGRLAFYDGGTFRIYDPVTKTLTSNYLGNNYYNYQIVTNTIIYAINDSKLYKIDISDLNAINSEIIFDAGNLQLPQFYVSNNGNTIYYAVENYYLENQNKIYKKVGDVSEEIYVGGESVNRKMIELNDNIYLFDYSSVYELVDGNITYYNYVNNINQSSIININNVLYASQDQIPGILDISNTYENEDDTFEPLPISEDEEIDQFTIDPNSGNLYTVNSGYDENFNTITSVSFYQLSPQIKIPAGDTSGTFTITGENDELYELTESIIVQPGTPTNASYSDALVTNYIVNPINLELTDNDDLPVVVFEFSAPTIDENSSTTVTLTASSVSGAEIIIPFTLTQDASSAVLDEEFIIVDDVRQIVIPANGNSASITISTTGLDDTAVEASEPITFNFETITNATSDVTDITLNLESDDDPTITAIGTTGDVTSQVEDGSFEVTASINSPTSKDVTIPLTLSGDAIFGEDYTINFDTEGEETQILDLQTNDYGTMRTFPDGRIAFKDYWTLRIYDPVSETLTEKSIYEDYFRGDDYQIADDTHIYFLDNNKLNKVDISDLNAVTYETVVNTGNLSLRSFYVADDGNTIYYAVRNDYQNDSNIVWKKEGNNDPESIYVGNNSLSVKILEVNDNIYLFRNSYVDQLIDGVLTNRKYYENIDRNKLFTINNKVYALYNNEPSILDISLDNLTFTSLPVSKNSEDDVILQFILDANSGNIFTLNQGLDDNFNSVRSVNSYQLSPQIKINAGDTSGTLTIAVEDDDLYELSESLIIQPRTPANATYSDALVSNEEATPIALELIDNNDLSEVEFEFSAPTIDENSSTTVTLTASSVSGAEITIPFTLTQDATSAVLGEEFIIVDDVRQIVIPANGNSASITISTTGLDDTEVEVQEPITFNFGTITNATSNTENITLFLESDDPAKISAIATTGLINSQVEDGSFEVFASLEQASSKDVTIPVTLSGDATLNEDYTVSFDSEGEKSLLYNSDQSFGKMKILPDGKYIFLQEYTLRIYNPEDNSLITKQLGNYYEANIGIGVISNTSFYAKINPGSIYKVDFSDLEAITETPHVDLQQNSWVPEPFTFLGETLYYSVYDGNSGQRTQFKKVGDADPEILGTLNDGFRIVDINDTIYFIGDSWFIEYVGEQLTYDDRIWFNMNNFRLNYSKLEVYNNEIYTVNQQANNKPGKLSISGTQVSFSPLPVTETSSINYLDIDSTTGDLILQVSEYTNSNYSYSVNSYQLSPQLKIPAGQTTGTFNIAGIDDDIFELTESLVVSPGTPVNAIYSDALVAEGVAIPVTLELEDNDTESEVIFEFSSPTIDENSSTTVTLTATSDSGAEITIPFTITQDASSAVLGEEFIIVDDVRQIVIPANGTSASITISTTGLDDTLVEIQEPITFNFGTITNATSETTEITLLLNSDDDPVITSIGTTGDVTSQVEDGSFEVTASINLPTSKEVTIPFTLSGDAIFNEDYTVSFDSEGEKSLLYNSGSQSFGRMKILPDGKYIFLQEYTLRIYNPEDNSIITKQLGNYYEGNIGIGVISNTSFIAKINAGSIYKVDFSDLEAITETTHVDLQQNTWVNEPFTFSGETLYYSVYDGNSGQRTQFKKVGDADPEILGTLNEGFRIVDINDTIYFIGDSWFIEYVGEQLTSNDRIWFNMNNFNLNYSKLEVYNNEIYTVNQQANNKPGKLSISGTQVSFSPLPVTETSSINYLDIDSTTGNLILQVYEYTNSNNSYSVNSYQLAPQLKIAAGETTGTFTLTGKDDDLFELTESLIVLPSAAKNATFSDDLLTDGIANPLTLELTDNDEFSDVVFEFSSPTIDENSSTTVTLTASSVSGADITIPFTITQDAASAVLDEEYVIVDDVRQIVIPANGNSASITISTLGLDDEEVEIQEPIIFTFGDVVNATTETQDATLFIVSDDDPNFTGITVSKNEFAEHESTNITANIDVPASRDVNVNLTFTGTATNNLDYSASFDNEGEKSLIKNIGNENYGSMQVLPDGKLVFLKERTIRIYDSENDTTIEKELSSYYDGSPILVVLNNNILYARTNNNNINEIDISNTDAITETPYISAQNGISFEHHMSVSVNTLIYQIYDSNDSSMRHKVFKKTGNADPERIYGGDRAYYAHVMLNDKIYAIGDYNIFELIDGEYVNERYLNYNDRLNSRRTIVYNNEIYSIKSNSNTIVKLDMLEEEYTYEDGSTNVNYNVTFEPLPISEDKQIQYFNFNSIGNLVAQNYVYENGDNNYELSEYQIIPQVTILAGQTSGSLTLNGIEDELNSPGEEEDETIILNLQEPSRAVLPSDDLIDDITLTLLNNQIDLVEDVAAFANVPELSSSSVAWGDFDRDGDQDMAIMGRGLQDGVITRLYENEEGIFVNNNPDAFDPRYEGDLIWVDYNKDGYIDLIVSGLDNTDNPATTIYENQAGTFVPSTDLVLPNLFGTSMDSGDLDNDGDIDFVINGMEIVNGVNTWRKYIYLREGNTLVEEEDFNNQFNTDNGVKNGSVIIADNQFDGDLDIIIVGENGSKNQINTLIDSNPCQYWWQCDNYITNLNFSSTTLFGNYIYYMGQRENDDEMKMYRRSLLSNSEQELSGVVGLIKGSIAVADYNNDGKPDMLVTGENENAESITKLYNGLNDGSSFSENTEVNLFGLRNSTAKWVDYDVDGDLDLFISGTSDEGERIKIYRTDLLNKTNAPSSVVTGLTFEDLDYGKVKLSWDAPDDDFSSNLGYVIRLATSEGGSEISNTESNLETGQRLITKSPVIYNNSYETLLDPGVYYWSVQSVDDGLKGSQFSEENSFTLTYEWKELNQGGIIDRSINAVGKPIVKLTDIDFDNDMDLIYGSKSNNNDIQVFKLGAKKFLYEENINNSRNISDIKFYDFNSDKIQDILINTWDKNSSQGSFKLYNTRDDSNQIFNETFYAPGLFQSKVELIDINNDGLEEVVHIGRTNAESNSQLKVHVYEQQNGSLNPNFTDISAQFGLLKSGSFAFGNADGDSDIDFAITGLTNQGITSNLYENQTLSTEIIDPVYTQTVTEFPSAEDSTLDFFDYDGDGDLDIAITGQGITGPMFKILSNNGETGSDLEFVEVPNTGLIPIREANLDFGDYNSDGYTDILYSGKVSGQGQVTKLVEFDPITQTYVDSDFDLSDIINASIAFGDIDGDNDLDFAIAGESISNSGESIIKTYLNLRDESAAVLENASSGRDGDVYVVNQRPSKPTQLISEVLGYNGDSNTYEVKFSWDSGDDESTPKEGLTSALKIVSSDGDEDIMTINSLDNGYRLSAGKGNVEHSTEWIINLPDLPDNKSYSWTVQTIDAAFSGSELAPVQQLDVDLIKLGDSNGDFEVTVLDLVTDVDYILGNVPNKFVFEAADVNNDESINVLDITATVDIILNPVSTRSTGTSGILDYYPSSAIGSAFFTWEGNDLYVESEYNIGGIQLSFDTDFEYELSSDLTSVEPLDFTTDNYRSLMLYSFNNTIIANSKTKLLTRIDNSKDVYEDKIVVGTINGEKLNGFLKSSDIENQEFELFNLYPNPSDGLVNLEYFLPTEMDVVDMHIYDIQGRLVWSQQLGNSSGIITNQLNLNRLSLGNYILSMHAYKNGTLKHVANKRLILK